MDALNPSAGRKAKICWQWQYARLQKKGQKAAEQVHFLLTIVWRWSFKHEVDIFLGDCHVKSPWQQTRKMHAIICRCKGISESPSGDGGAFLDACLLLLSESIALGGVVPLPRGSPLPQLCSNILSFSSGLLSIHYCWSMINVFIKCVAT